MLWSSALELLFLVRAIEQGGFKKTCFLLVWFVKKKSAVTFSGSSGNWAQTEMLWSSALELLFLAQKLCCLTVFIAFLMWIFKSLELHGNAVIVSSRASVLGESERAERAQKHVVFWFVKQMICYWCSVDLHVTGSRRKCCDPQLWSFCSRQEANISASGEAKRATF